MSSLSWKDFGCSASTKFILSYSWNYKFEIKLRNFHRISNVYQRCGWLGNYYNNRNTYNNTNSIIICLPSRCGVLLCMRARIVYILLWKRPKEGLFWPITVSILHENVCDSCYKESSFYLSRKSIWARSSWFVPECWARSELFMEFNTCVFQSTTGH